MKKIIIITLLVVLGQASVFAQKPTNVKEQDVPSRYVKDFQKQMPVANKVQWTKIDSLTYEVSYRTESGNPQSIVFTNKGYETHYFIEPTWYPHAIMDSVKHMYPHHKIASLYVRNVKGKATYQTRIAKIKGLFRKKETDIHILNFETNGVFISAE